MRIDGFRFRYLGPFGSEGVSVDGLVPGLNVIAEHNERGKSSLLRGLQLFLLQGHTSWGKRGKAVERDDGNTTGEIDFTHDGTAYRLIKTYRRRKDAQLIDRKTGTVLARKGEADERLAAIMGTANAAKGPSGLLWIEQGQSMASVQDDGLVASKIETEMSTLVGGDRARDYLARTEAALGELLTATGKSRVGGPLKTAEDALQQIEAQLIEAEKRRDKTRQTGRDLQRARNALATLQAQADSDIETQINTTRTALETARNAREKWEKTKAMSLRLSAEYERANDQLARHLDHVAQYDTAKTGLDTEQETIQACEARRHGLQAAQAQIDQDLRDLRQAQAKLAERDAMQARADRLRDRQDALAQLQKRLDALDDVLSVRAARIEARNSLPDLDRKALDRIGELDARSSQLDRALSSVDAHLRLELQPGAKADIDGQAVTSGPVRLSAASVLNLPGVGRIHLDPPEADAMRAERDRVRRDRDTLLQEAGVDDYAAAADIVRARDDVSADLQSIEREIARIAPQGRETLIDHRQALERDIATLQDRLSEATDSDAARAGDRAADAVQISADIAETSAERSVTEDELQDIAGQIEGAKARLDGHRRALAALPSEAGPETRDARRSELASLAAVAQSRFEQVQADVEALWATPQNDPDILKASLTRLIQVRDNRSAEQAELTQRIIELKALRSGALDRSDPDSEATALAEQRDALRETVAIHRRRADSLTLLRDTLSSAQRQLQNEYTAPVRRELAPLLARVIDGADFELSESLGPQGLMRDGRDDTLDRLSGGTREQIAILTRLAFARLLARGGQPCPIILDDALVHADDDRRARMFDVLNYVGSGDEALQLIYLSCHERAARDLGGHKLQLGGWPEN